MEQVGKKGVLETDVLTVALHGTFPFIHPWFYFLNEQVLPIPRFVRLFKDSCREDRRCTERLGLTLGMTMFIHSKGALLPPIWADGQNVY